MKKTLITSAILAATALAANAFSIDLSNPPTGVTVSGTVNTNNTVFSAPADLLGSGESVSISFPSPADISLEIWDLDTNVTAEIASISINGGPFQEFTGVAGLIDNLDAPNQAVLFSATGVTTIEIASTGSGHGVFGIANIDSSVPEPSTALLGGLGALALIRRRR